MKSVLIYKAFERFWHWAQAFLVILLGITGFEIHGSFEFFGFENAVDYHNRAAFLFIGLIVFAIFWHYATGEWKQYIPTTKSLKEQIQYYLFGIFKKADHPHEKTELSKLNPLQRLVYLALKILVFPVMVGSGIIYMLFRYTANGIVLPLGIGGLNVVAIVHTAGAFFLAAFLIVHLYLITTGETVTSNMKAMITGYEDLPDHGNPSADNKNLEEIPDAK